MKTLDLNCDMGESYGAWHMGQDEAVLGYVSSANIACGFHAGDPVIMRRTVEAAARRGVAVGAHPSLPDLQGFGRRAMAIAPEEAYALTLYQTGALAAFARAAGARLHHVKPHGALYNMAAKDRALADAIAAAVRDFDGGLVLVGLAGSALVEAGRAAGLAVAREAFADRRYRADGSLTPRSEADAVIDDVAAAVEQALSIATRGEALAGDGARVVIEADTLCVHGDRADAATFARRLRAALEDAGVRIAAPERGA
ncbi:LamB/YcsF family protein [Mizugakiibacter sediminis]|uniref:5-oxoprolinase subunit A n=1 Tax=Mizugakiibacter sediminis TaxID=1475481 RepID=A0A0K8QJG0_9GAMM|nr:5-oxoprolinase subunit PxpA [Mizugakiibacter sediminis]GAP64964.1 LamB/YcsF family protein [Mizugakiibacter sediminis]